MSTFRTVEEPTSREPLSFPFVSPATPDTEKVTLERLVAQYQPQNRQSLLIALHNNHERPSAGSHQPFLPDREREQKQVTCQSPSG